MNCSQEKDGSPELFVFFARAPLGSSIPHLKSIVPKRTKDRQRVYSSSSGPSIPEPIATSPEPQLTRAPARPFPSSEVRSCSSALGARFVVFSSNNG